MILITMAGMSSRFFKAGYTEPKYKLPIFGESVFSLSVKSFEAYFRTDKFVFVIREAYETYNFVKSSCSAMGIVDFDIITLPAETAGQAETAYLALKQYPGDFPVTIFNIDTFRYGYQKPSFINECDGYLEVFKGEGEHWSFIEPGEGQTVRRTTEKERISNYCSDGLYHFNSKSEFENAFLEAQKSQSKTQGEYYIAPLYNLLISQKKLIKYMLISSKELDFCGTPAEYQLCLEKKEGREN
ncbi:capsular biosynthesis protein [Pseudomonas sp. NPDC077382]